MATKVDCHLAKAMTPSPLRDSHAKNPFTGVLIFFIGPAKVMHQSDFAVSARNA
jgi:hypothetical protein